MHGAENSHSVVAVDRALHGVWRSRACEVAGSFRPPLPLCGRSAAVASPSGVRVSRARGVAGGRDQRDLCEKPEAFSYTTSPRSNPELPTSFPTPEPPSPTKTASGSYPPPPTAPSAQQPTSQPASQPASQPFHPFTPFHYIPSEPRSHPCPYRATFRLVLLLHAQSRRIGQYLLHLLSLQVAYPGATPLNATR